MAEQEAPGSGLSTQTAIATAEMLKGGLWGEMKGHQTVTLRHKKIIRSSNTGLLNE